MSLHTDISIQQHYWKYTRSPYLFEDKKIVFSKVCANCFFFAHTLRAFSATWQEQMTHTPHWEIHRYKNNNNKELRI